MLANNVVSALLSKTIGLGCSRRHSMIKLLLHSFSRYLGCIRAICSRSSVCLNFKPSFFMHAYLPAYRIPYDTNHRRGNGGGGGDRTAAGRARELRKLFFSCRFITYICTCLERRFCCNGIEHSRAPGWPRGSCALHTITSSGRRRPGRRRGSLPPCTPAAPARQGQPSTSF